MSEENIIGTFRIEEREHVEPPLTLKQRVMDAIRSGVGEWYDDDAGYEVASFDEDIAFKNVMEIVNEIRNENKGIS